MADPQDFSAVDVFIDGLFAPEDAVLTQLHARALAEGLPKIEVSAGQGKLLHLLAKMTGAHRILEIGTLGGYSGIWLARALPKSGELVTLELDAAYAAFAEDSFDQAQLSKKVRVLQGRALELLAGLDGPFDLVFLDANKDDYPAYLIEVARLLRPGGLLLADNVIRKGAVLSPPTDDIMAQGAARFLDDLSASADFQSIVLQQVGIKGHDGLAVALRT